jgi:hypothetical protein
MEEEGKQAMSNTLTALPRNECLQIMDQVRIFLFLLPVFRILLFCPLPYFPARTFQTLNFSRAHFSDVEQDSSG